ncbi:MAG: hypothetical protein CM15mV26_0150 [uncultured marine virus]|nr:MAG: hypothetical protein CM15mV26_0150 [uncultured marine virus]
MRSYRPKDQIIADMRELMDGEKSVAYLFKKPQKIVINSPCWWEDDAETAATVSLPVDSSPPG